MKVVLSGIYYPMAILRYFEAALRRRTDIELFTVGPDTGYEIPWQGGMTIQTEQKILAPDFCVSKGFRFLSTTPISYIESRLPWKPDLWLQIDASYYFEGRPTNGKNFIVGTDPHCLNYDRQRLYADKFFCMQKHYAKAGDEFLPYAFDPIWHSPENETEQIYDVSFVGVMYKERKEVIEALKQKGVNVFHTTGPIFNEARHIYNQAPISFNWSSLQDLTARVFELLGMRRLAVVNKVPDLGNFFQDGSDLIAFDNNLAECVERILYFIAHKEEAKKIAEQGHKTVQPHTWDARVAQILEMV